jgi:hypothetical protein
MSKKHKQVGIRYTDESNSQISRQEVVLMARSSFLPTPKELKEYEELLPGITERFFSAFEKQQEHRFGLEKNAVFTGSKRTLQGQIFAFILGLVTIVGGLFLLFQGKDIQGYSLLVGTVATLAGVFIYGKKQNKKERIEKARLNPEEK